MSNNLTRRQQAVYDHLCKRHQRHEQPPTLDELCDALGLSSRGSMHKHVQALIEAGLVEPMQGKQRGVRLLEPPERQPEQLPLFGYIAAGRPIEAIENPETLEVPRYLRTEKPCFVLKVKGDSMVEDGILEGDWVIVEQRDHARNGEIVVALVDGSDATLKRILQRPGEVLLYPANSDMEPMSYPPERVQIQGVVVGQMRAYR
jgi:repressor LexA